MFFFIPLSCFQINIWENEITTILYKSTKAIRFCILFLISHNKWENANTTIKPMGVFPWIYWFLHGLQKVSHCKSVWKNEGLGRWSILQNSLKVEYAGRNISLEMKPRIVTIKYWNWSHQSSMKTSLHPDGIWYPLPHKVCKDQRRYTWKYFKTLNYDTNTFYHYG